jgi:hypothetical protein
MWLTESRTDSLLLRSRGPYKDGRQSLRLRLRALVRRHRHTAAPFPRKDISTLGRAGLLTRGSDLLSMPSQGHTPQRYGPTRVYLYAHPHRTEDHASAGTLRRRLVRPHWCSSPLALSQLREVATYIPAATPLWPIRSGLQCVTHTWHPRGSTRPIASACRACASCRFACICPSTRQTFQRASSTANSSASPGGSAMDRALALLPLHQAPIPAS